MGVSGHTPQPSLEPGERKRSCKHLFSEERDNRQGFVCGNKLLWLHASVNKDSFYTVHRAVKCEGRSRLHNKPPAPGMLLLPLALL